MTKAYQYRFSRPNGVQTYFSTISPPEKLSKEKGEWFEHNPFKENAESDGYGEWHKCDKPRGWK